jgi:hypothetical protein
MTGREGAQLPDAALAAATAAGLIPEQQQQQQPAGAEAAVKVFKVQWVK